jgi:hypothetical protein
MFFQKFIPILFLARLYQRIKLIVFQFKLSKDLFLISSALGKELRISSNLFLSRGFTKYSMMPSSIAFLTSDSLLDVVKTTTGRFFNFLFVRISFKNSKPSNFGKFKSNIVRFGSTVADD